MPVVCKINNLWLNLDDIQRLCLEKNSKFIGWGLSGLKERFKNFLVGGKWYGKQRKKKKSYLGFRKSS